MLTPQEVSSKTFPKAVMGGYAMAQVDEFLDILTEDYGSLYKENAALKGKIKALMEKIEEYRQVEDSMRATLLAAQRMAKEMVTEAEAKRDAINAEAAVHRATLLGDAEAAAQQRINELKAMIAVEEQNMLNEKMEIAAQMAAQQQKLERAQQAVVRYLQVSRANCEEQLKVLQRLEEMVPEQIEVPAAPAAAPAAASVMEIPAPVEPEEADFAAPFPPVDVPAPIQEEMVPDEAFFTSPLPTREDLKKVQVSPMDEEEDFLAGVQSAVDELAEEKGQESIWDDLPEDATRIINLDELQFGRNYNKED